MKQGENVYGFQAFNSVSKINNKLKMDAYFFKK